MNSIARFPAVLRGSDVDSKCTLEAWVEHSSTGRVFTRCRIVDDAPDLPDGPYEVVFANHAVKTRKAMGQWELVFVPAELGIDLLLWCPGIAS
ncbi:MAG TPA: hypothetical protein VIY53_17715 [Acidobacteriaceae bacterium]